MSDTPALIGTSDPLLARFILQVNLVHRPGVQAKMGTFNLWKKGGRFGSSDEMLKFCAGNGCMGFFSDTFTLTKKEAKALGEDRDDVSKWPPIMREKYQNWHLLPVVCTKCGSTQRRFQLADTYGFNMTVDRIAVRMSQFFNALGRDADVYLVRSKHYGGMQKAREELYSADHSRLRYEKRLDQARDREQVFYPLKRIIDDSVGTGSPEHVFKAMLKA